MEEKPKILYKYHKINNFLFDLLSENCFWFSLRKELNDPFDCKLHLSDEFRDNLLRSSFVDMIRDITNDERVDIPNEDVDKYIDIFTNNDRDSYIDNTESLFEDKLNLGYRICCFTVDNTNQLMWSHYAESYKGVCLGFNLSSENVLPVKYSQDKVILNSFDDLEFALFTKNSCWSYENEYRIVSFGTRGKVKFSKNSLKSITFGHKVSDLDIERVADKARELNYINISFNRVRILGNDLKIEVLFVT